MSQVTGAWGRRHSTPGGLNRRKLDEGGTHRFCLLLLSWDTGLRPWDRHCTISCPGSKVLGLSPELHRQLSWPPARGDSHGSPAHGQARPTMSRWFCFFGELELTHRSAGRGLLTCREAGAAGGSTLSCVTGRHEGGKDEGGPPGAIPAACPGHTCSGARDGGSGKAPRRRDRRGGD